MQFINQMEPSYDEKERNAINEYMMSGAWLMEFKKTREFEERIAEYVGAKYCSIMPNGTLSLVVALLACDIKAGDEVIVPDFTMVATPNAAELIGAKAVFVDVNRKNLCLDFEKMKAVITEKTKAVMLVSINGRLSEEIEQIVSFCKENEICLIEDAAQALGSFFQGKHIGTYGRIGSFSFSVPKIITTGQGGALVTDDDEMIEKIKKIRDFGREKSGADHYLIKGWNMKFTDLQAVIGIEQMKKLPQRVVRKREMGCLYNKLLTGIPGIELLSTDLSETTPWFFDILCDRRSELIQYLKEKNIGSREFYPPLHAEPAYGYMGKFPVTEEIAAKGLWLPSSISLTDGQIRYVCNCIKEFYAFSSCP